MGVLNGIRVLEFEAIGPGPFGAMLLADMGADVLRIDRPAAPDDLGPKTN
ncbi:CoA transferase, partial [Paraburkholderia sp. SIMBA_055]